MEQDILDLVDLVLEIKNVEEYIITLILDFKEDFCKKISEEKEKLPYNINLLDEIHANENAHSRIFIKLLQYKDINNFKLLNLFLSYIGEPFSQLKFKNPIITAEKDRIDIRIRGQNETLIIENKIHGAGDQEQQIKRYIDIEIDAKYDINSNIYVLYLTRDGGTPSEDSLPREEEKALGKRYKKINYRDDILPWLKTLVDNDDQWLASNKLEILRSAIIQYIDHLEGIFLQRKEEEKMKNVMGKLVKQKIKLDKTESLSKKIEIISSYQEYIKDLGKYFSELEREIKVSIFSSLNIFAEQLKEEDFDGIKEIKFENKFGEKGSEVIFHPTGWNENYTITIGFEKDFNDLYCGIPAKNEQAPEELQTKLSKTINIKCDESDKYWPFLTFFKTNQDLEELIISIENRTLLEEIKDIIFQILEKTKNVKELHK